ncbi:MAG: hypothetical protein HOP15_07755 [Planctomycetes bacterium]|nr:hypothetical protein [Planctomycetota bacterium]
MSASANGAVASRVLRFILRGLSLAWAGFWTWFVVSATIGDPGPVPWWIPVAWLASLGTLVVLVWRWPTLGGFALVASGVWAAVYFDNPGARALLAAPAVGIGVGCLVLGWRARWLASAALLALGLTLSACIVPQDPADLPFRTSSILRHEDGRMRRALLVEETEIAGFPCQRWVWWYEDGRIDNVELALDLSVQGHDFPVGTRLFFDREGRLAHAWLSRDALIDGRPCRGRMKVDTAFHPNGRVRAFFPRRPLEIDGVLCAASVFHPIYLHPDGRLRQCKLAREVTLDGRTFEKGALLALDESGHALR